MIYPQPQLIRNSFLLAWHILMESPKAFSASGDTPVTCLSCRFLHYGQVRFHLSVNHSAGSQGKTVHHSRPCPWIIHLSQWEKPTLISASIFPLFTDFSTALCALFSELLSRPSLSSEPCVSSAPQPSRLSWWKSFLSFCEQGKRTFF